MTLLLVLIIISAGWGSLYYKTPFNPVTIFAAFDVFILGFISIAIGFNFSHIDMNDVNALANITSIYFFGFLLGFITPVSATFKKKIILLISSFDRESTISVSKSIRTSIILFFIAISFLIILINVSSVGMMWIYDPREAYLNNRAGVGIIWLLYQWSAMSWLIYTLCIKKINSTSKYIYLCSIYSILMYFSGSKGAILVGVVITIIHFDRHHSRINLFSAFIIAFILIILFLTLLFSQGAYDSLFNSLKYFGIYAETTAIFINNFDNIGFKYGLGHLTDLWFYVPRMFYAEKPYEYGVTLIHQYILPGAAESGHTPGVMQWALSYLDFGIFGVFFYGILLAFIRRFFYCYFRVSNNIISSTALGVSVSLFPVYIYATLPILITALIFISFISRLKLKVPSKI